MFRLIIKSCGSQMEKGKGSGQPRLKIWLRQLTIVAVSLAFLPVVLLSLAVFIAIFMVLLVAALAYGLRLRSKLQRIESHQVIDGEYKVVPDDDNQQKRLKGERSTQQRK